MTTVCVVASCAVLQIAQLFVSPIGGDGRPVLESYTGAYAVKINIGGKWQVVHRYLTRNILSAHRRAMERLRQ